MAPERYNRNANEFEALAMGALSLNRKTSIRGALLGKYFSDNELDFGGAIVGGIGGGLTRKLSGWLFFDADLRFYFGSINNGAKYVSLLGLQSLLGIRVFL